MRKNKKLNKILTGIVLVLLITQNIATVSLAQESNDYKMADSEKIELVQKNNLITTTTEAALELENLESIKLEGKGTEQEPYLVKTALDLKWISDNNNKFEGFDDIYFKQYSNIDMNNIQFEPIGTTENYFNGYYDGNLKKISNLKINSDKKYVGLFGRVKYPVLKNIILENVDINSSNGSGYLGGIIGYSKSIDIVNCHVIKNSKISGNSEYVGGIAGKISDTTIKNCTFDGTVVASRELDKISVLGGIAGESVETSDIINCHTMNNSIVRGIGNVSYIGGISGYIDINSLDSCSSYGKIEFIQNQYSSNGIDIGGIVGDIGTNSSDAISNCFNASNVIVTEANNLDIYIGGIVGGFDSSGSITDIVKNCISIGKLSEKEKKVNVGGILGFLSSGGYDFKESFYLDTTAYNSLGNFENLDGKVADLPKTKAELESSILYNTWDNSKWDIRDGQIPILKNMPKVNLDDEIDTQQKSKKSGSSGVALESTPVVLNSSNIKVNGSDKSAGNVETLKIDGESIKRIIVDTDILKQLIDKEENKALVTIPFSDSDICESVFTGQMIKNMQNKESVLEIKTPTLSYIVPALAIDIEDISNKLGKSVNLKDIKINIKLAEIPNQKLNTIKSNIEKEYIELVSNPVEFSINCTYNQNSVYVEKFNQYVSRSIAIPENIDLNKMTTGVIIGENGDLHHVPTIITEKNGKYFANINSITNSVYAIVWNKVKFNDINNHWAKSSINDMGARMAVNGINKELFLPNKDITRGEFASFIVNSFGLKLTDKDNIFKDVSKEELYSDEINTAAEYGIINGYNDKLFKPKDNITREEAMTIITNIIKCTNLDSKIINKEYDKRVFEFNDTDKISPFAKESVDFCISSGIVRGKADKLIGPKDYITRAETTVIIQRLLQNLDFINK